jgi:hypothetical protein
MTAEELTLYFSAANAGINLEILEATRQKIKNEEIHSMEIITLLKTIIAKMEE